MFYPPRKILYLQNKKYPAQIHEKNTINLKSDVVGIMNISNIPAAAQRKANPNTRFMSTFPIRYSV